MKREKSRILPLLFLLIASFFLGRLPAQDLPTSDPVQITLISEGESVQPGHPFWVALRLKMADHWHSYWKNPGDSGMPTAVEWSLPPGFSAGPIEWPYPQRMDLDSLIGYGYEGEVWLLTKITPPAEMKADTEATFKADVRWLVCSDTTCLPGDTELSLKLPVENSLPLPHKQWMGAFDRARAKLPQQGWTASAERSGTSIQLALEAPSSAEPFKKALFFPEMPRTIDAQTEAQLEIDQTGRYKVALKTQADANPEQLKGVLVLSHEQATQAIAIDIPLKGTIALAETSGEELVSPETSTFDGGFAMALLLAFIGGSILNLMPCVLPVVSFKILSFVKMAGQSRRKTFQHGIAFSGGVIVSFWVLAGLLLLLQAYGHSVGWGFQLQEPIFVALLAALLLIFGLSLFGVFEIGTSLIGMASEAQQRVSGFVGSFFSGVLATTVATPCTGPFLGTAVGFAVTLPAFMSLAIFTSVGLGMAAPYLALTAFPSLLRFLPKPGAWMVTFKELMGFLMLGTVLWLTWVFGAQTGNLGLFLLLSSFFFIALASWIYGKWGAAARSKAVRVTGLLCAVIFMALAGTAIVKASFSGTQETEHVAAAGWEPFSEERVAELQSQGIPVFIDFTAKWCLICQANHLVLSSKEVSEAFDRMGVVRMKADWTRNDPAITAALKKYGRNSVPLYLFYGANQQTPKILPQVLTPDVILSHLRAVEVTAER